MPFLVSFFAAMSGVKQLRIFVTAITFPNLTDESSFKVGNNDNFRVNVSEELLSRHSTSVLFEQDTGSKKLVEWRL